MAALGKNPWLIQRPAVRIQPPWLILHFALILTENFFCLDNPGGSIYIDIDIHNDYY